MTLYPGLCVQRLRRITAGEALHTGEGEELLAEVFYRCAYMIKSVVNDHKPVVDVGCRSDVYRGGYWSLCLSKPSSKRLSILFVYIVAVTPLLRLSINARTVLSMYLSMRMMCLSACFIRLLTKTCASKICPSKRMPSRGGNDVLRKDSTLPENSFIRRSCSERRWSIRLSI